MSKAHEIFLGAISTEVPWSEVGFAVGIAPEVGAAILCNAVAKYVQDTGKPEDWDDPELMRLWMICKRAGGTSSVNPPGDYWKCLRTHY
jgi:hypothetical protein